MNKYFLLFLLWLSITNFAFSQITFNVAVPYNTPSNAAIYLAGTFNSWTNNATAYQLTRQTDALSGAYTYSITITPPVGAVAYKFTRGSWPSVEGNATGDYIPDRSLTYSGLPMVVNLSIQTWEDLNAPSHTLASNTQILNSSFYMPQLNRNRRVWIYLPIDYLNSTKNYPVIYMHDAQNLFDVATSFSGEWQVDEALNTKMGQGNYGAIVVGIDNGGADRINEYSPWVNAQYGGGQGDEYINFIIETLKPYIDTHFRTLPCREHTGIAGSSMGGLISLYASVARQDVFGRAGIFSPSIWFANTQVFDLVDQTGKQFDMKYYLVGGASEGSSMATYINQLYTNLLIEGFTTTEVTKLLPADGQHAEWFWAREFPAAYDWLFGNLANGSSTIVAGNNSHDVCSNQTISYSTAPVAGASSYTWSVTGGTIISGQGTTTVSIQWGNNTTGQISVAAQ
ncbi:MAG: alpha/beta hydrolase [Chitinophagales bacterium]|nr:alpha/beta hydrolase [Chitinophagales bacterium]